MNEIIELLFHYTQTIYQYPCESGLTDRCPQSKPCTPRPRFHWSKGPRWGGCQPSWSTCLSHYCTLTRALTFSDTSGVRACLVREILRIESVAVAAQTLAVSDGVTRARIIMRMTRAVTGVEQPLDIVSRARLAESRRASLVWTKARAFSRGDTAVSSVFVANVDVPCKIGQLGVAVARAVS